MYIMVRIRTINNFLSCLFTRALFSLACVGDNGDNENCLHSQELKSKEVNKDR
jgi:hypothetical protein